MKKSNIEEKNYQLFSVGKFVSSVLSAACVGFYSVIYQVDIHFLYQLILTSIHTRVIIKGQGMSSKTKKKKREMRVSHRSPLFQENKSISNFFFFVVYICVYTCVCIFLYKSQESEYKK